MQAAYAANTRRNYEACHKRFREWCETRGLEALPALPEAVAVFLSTRAQEGCKLATIRLDRAGISATHREA